MGLNQGWSLSSLYKKTSTSDAVSVMTSANHKVRNCSHLMSFAHFHFSTAIFWLIFFGRVTSKLQHVVLKHNESVRATPKCWKVEDDKMCRVYCPCQILGMGKAAQRRANAKRHLLSRLSPNALCYVVLSGPRTSFCEVGNQQNYFFSSTSMWALFINGVVPKWMVYGKIP